MNGLSLLFSLFGFTLFVRGMAVAFDRIKSRPPKRVGLTHGEREDRRMMLRNMSAVDNAIAFLGTDYVLHGDYRFSERHRLDIGQDGVKSDQ